jgi:hypothetical protein
LRASPFLILYGAAGETVIVGSLIPSRPDSLTRLMRFDECGPAKSGFVEPIETEYESKPPVGSSFGNGRLIQILVLMIARIAAFSGSASVAQAVTTRDRSGPKATEFRVFICVSGCGFSQFAGQF